MSEEIPFLTPVESVGYADASLRPSRPGILVAVGVISIVLSVIVPIVNCFAIVSLNRLQAAFNARPQAINTAPVPLTPLVPPVPFQGDYLPSGGMPAAGRGQILAVVSKKVALNPDRQMMLDRLLAEVGTTIFSTPNISPDSIQSHQESTGPDGSGAMGPQVITVPSGDITLNDATAGFYPANGPSIFIKGNIVDRPGFNGFTAGVIDQCIDDVQRRSSGGLNALQAGALADLIRQIKPWSGNPEWDWPTFDVDPPLAAGTISVHLRNSFGIHSYYLLTNGYLRDTSTGSFDAATGIPLSQLPPPTPNQPAPQPPSLPLDAWIIYGSYTEYLLSLLLAPLLLIASIRLLMEKPDGAWLHGVYVVIKPWLALANFALGVCTVSQLSDVHAYGGFGESLAWIMILVAVVIQFSYPIALLAVFSSIPIRRYEFQRGNSIGPAGAMFPPKAVAVAARLTPENWDRLFAAFVALVSATVLSAEALRLTTYAGDFKISSWISTNFLATCTVAGLLLIIGIARVFQPSIVAREKTNV